MCPTMAVHLINAIATTVLLFLPACRTANGLNVLQSILMLAS
jgi:hypothetical protein